MASCASSRWPRWIVKKAARAEKCGVEESRPALRTEAVRAACAWGSSVVDGRGRRRLEGGAQAGSSRRPERGAKAALTAVSSAAGVTCRSCGGRSQPRPQLLGGQLSADASAFLVCGRSSASTVVTLDGEPPAACSTSLEQLGSLSLELDVRPLSLLAGSAERENESNSVHSKGQGRTTGMRDEVR